MMELGVTAVMLPELAFQEQLDICTELGVKYYQYRPRVIAEDQRDQPYTNWGNHKFDLTPELYLKSGAKLTEQLRERGMEPWGAVFNCLVDQDDDVLKQFVEAVALSEAGCMRCQPPQYPRGPFDYTEYLKKTIHRYEYVIGHISGPAGVKLILETHFGSAVSGPGMTYNVLQHFDPKHMGAIFDMPNYAREGEINPWLAVATLKPWIDCLHMGGAERFDQGRDEFGSRQVQTRFSSLQDSEIHIPTWLQALQSNGLHPPVIIEDYDQRLTGTERLIRCVNYLKEILPILK